MTGSFLFDWLQLALSLFCCILLLWLGLTMLLNSERRTGSVLLVAGTAFLGSTFFAAHTAVLQFAGRIAAPSLDFWWKTGWLMLVALPYGWYAIVLWYGGYGDKASPLRQRHRLPATVLGALMATLLGALLLASPLPLLTQMLYLQPANVAAVLGVPWFLVLYPLYMLACLGQALLALHDAAGVEAAELGLARRRARPWLVATTALLGIVNVLVTAAIIWFHFLPRDGNVSPSMVLAGAAWFDLAVSLLLAAAIVLIGQAMVHFEIFSGRTLPRRELRRHWNYALVLAGGYGIVVGGSLTVGLRPIYDLLLSALLMAALFALTGWRTFQHQQAFVRRLQPFVAGTHLYAQLTAQAGGQEAPAAAGENAGRDLAQTTFAALCQDVLNTSYAVLLATGPLEMLVGRPLTYPPDAQTPPPPGPWLEQAARTTALCVPLRLAAAPQVAWALPLRSGDECIGVLVLGNRQDGSMYTEEEIAVARATGERLIDLRASAELALRLLNVQRGRLVESMVLDRQTRRVLHDDVLPELHTALLLLNQPPGEEMPARLAGDLAAAGELLASAHRRIADLLRSLPIGPALQPDGGLLPSLQRLMAGDFEGQFDRVEWEVSAEAAALAAALPPVTAEVVFYALREVIRNAARHGRGGDETRALALRIRVYVADGLHIIVHDDGIGSAGGAEAGAGADAAGAVVGGGHGLSLHTALLAVVGASLRINATPHSGTQVMIELPPISGA